MERSKNDVWVGLFVLLGAAALSCSWPCSRPTC
jgi:ABC-type transporter Mla subunit MlaD